MISDLYLGRLILMGFIIDDYYGDVREYQKSDKDVVDKTKFLYETGKTTIATITVMAPLWKTTMIGAGARIGAGWAAAKASAIATAAAPITAGYVIGATVGTVISEQLFGDEGAQTALGFYSLGLLPGTEAPTLSTYGNLLRPSETDVKGPVEIIGSAIRTGKQIVNIWWNRSPLHRPTFSNPYMMAF
jgi:hypothetical protein